MPNHDELSEALTAALENAGLSAEGLADRANVGKDTVGRWIRGETVPTARLLREVEACLAARLKRKVDFGPELAARKRRQAGKGFLERPRREAGTSLRDYLAELLAADYVHAGPREGEFAGLGDRRGEGHYQQPESREAADQKPSYFHTFWGLVGSKLLLSHDYESYAATTAEAVARRFGDDVWLTTVLPDYEATPTAYVSRLKRTRHTARGASILFLCDQHHTLASDIVWTLITELPGVMTRHGGVPEVLMEERQPSLHASAAVFQAICMACSKPDLPNGVAFNEQSRPLRQAIHDYLYSEWTRNRWAFGIVPWEVNAPSALADVAPYLSLAFRRLVAKSLCDQFLPSGRLRARPDEAFDAPGAILDLRTAYAVQQESAYGDDPRLRQALSRFGKMRWDDLPLTTADITFLSKLIGGSEQGSDKLLAT